MSTLAGTSGDLHFPRRKRSFMKAKPQKFSGLMIAGMAFVLTTGRCLAEERQPPVLTDLSSTTLNGEISSDLGPSSIAPVPEPSTVALLAGGTAVFGLMIRRKQDK
jgi:hypothetical protein